jgi:hypothetical protein
MTSNQTQLYWRLWAAAATAQGWSRVESLAAARAVRERGETWVSPSLDRVLSEIWRLADVFGGDPEGKISANDLRHACHAVATGRGASSKKLSNADFDAVLALFKLLADPHQIAHVVAWQNRADIGERKRYTYFITRTPAAYWRSIATDKFGHTDLAKLSLSELRQLTMTLKARSRAWRSPGGVPATCPA